MIICMVGDYSGDTVNGVDVAVSVLTHELIAQGHQVWYAYLSHRNASYVDANGIHHCEIKATTDFLSFSQVRRALFTTLYHVDVFHLHSVFRPCNYVFARELEQANKPYFVTPNGGYNENVLRRHLLKKQMYSYFFENHIVRGATGVVCVAEPEKHDLRQVGYRGHLAVIPNALPPFEASAEVSLSATEAGRQSVVYLGRYAVRHKGLDYLLHLAKAVAAKNDRVDFHLYGAGPDEMVLRKLQYRLRVDNVYLHQPVYGADKHRVLAGATLYLQPSRWEAFGISIAEAMAVGKPCAITEGCYLKDFFLQHEFGLILNQEATADADKLLSYLQDDALLAQHAAQAPQLAEEFSASSVAERHVALYQSTLLKQPKPTPVVSFKAERSVLPSTSQR